VVIAESRKISHRVAAWNGVIVEGVGARRWS